MASEKHFLLEETTLAPLGLRTPLNMTRRLQGSTGTQYSDFQLSTFQNQDYSIKDARGDGNQMTA